MKLNIAMVAACPFPANHGSPASIREMSEALSRRGHTVHIVTYPINEDIPVEGVAIHRVSSISRDKNNKITVGPTLQKPVFDLMMVFKLCQTIWREKIDIIHAHNYEGALIGSMAKVITGRPLLYNAVNNMISELPGYGFIRPKFLAVWLAKLLDHWTPKPADYMTVVSGELFDFFKNKGIDPDKMAVVPAGVNTGMFDTGDPEIIRKKFNIGTRPVIAYTGLLDSFQNVEYLIKAMERVTGAKKDVLLIMVSNLVDENRIAFYRNMARDLGLEENILFTGAVPLAELPHFLAAADIAVVPRVSCPGFPVKILNYMAAGKAIVSFEGSAKGLHHMYNGIVAEDHNVDALAAGIAKLVQDTELRRTLGANARKSIEGRFDWASISEKIELIYYKILGSLGRIRPALSQNEEQLIKKGFGFVHQDRRWQQAVSVSFDRRGGERRKRHEKIEFLERRTLA